MNRAAARDIAATHDIFLQHRSIDATARDVRIPRALKRGSNKILEPFHLTASQSSSKVHPLHHNLHPELWRA